MKKLILLSFIIMTSLPLSCHSSTWAYKILGLDKRDRLQQGKLISRLEHAKRKLLCLQGSYKIRRSTSTHPFINQLKNDAFLQQHFDTLSNNFFSCLLCAKPLEDIFYDALYSSGDSEQLSNHIYLQWNEFLSNNGNPELPLFRYLTPGNFHFVILEEKGYDIIESNMLIEHIIEKIDLEIQKLKNTTCYSYNK